MHMHAFFGTSGEKAVAAPEQSGFLTTKFVDEYYYVKYVYNTIIV